MSFVWRHKIGEPTLEHCEDVFILGRRVLEEEIGLLGRRERAAVSLVVVVVVAEAVSLVVVVVVAEKRCFFYV
jgi:hypothetical protein